MYFCWTRRIGSSIFCFPRVHFKEPFVTGKLIGLDGNANLHRWMKEENFRRNHKTRFMKFLELSKKSLCYSFQLLVRGDYSRYACLIHVKCGIGRIFWVADHESEFKFSKSKMADKICEKGFFPIWYTRVFWVADHKSAVKFKKSWLGIKYGWRDYWKPTDFC